jgi:hypothetical protein
MHKIVARFLLSGLLLLTLTVSAAPVEEMHQAGDRFTFETDTINGQIVKYPTVRDRTAWQYEPVAASQTNQAMGATGAAGDILHAVHCVFTGVPSAAVTLKDGANTAFNLFAIPAGADTKTAVLNLVSSNGAWQLTTGTNTTCVGIGRFS